MRWTNIGRAIVPAPHISAGYFNSANLNYEALAQKVKKFHRQKHHPPSSIKDYILANRRLQTINKRLDPMHKFSVPKHDLGLSLNVSSFNLERELWSFLRTYWAEAVSSDDVVKTFVLTCPDTDLSRSIDLVAANYLQKKPSILASAADSILVSILLRRLLQINDYQNSFKLLDSTVSNTAMVSRRKQAILKSCGAGAAVLAVSSAAHFLLHSMHMSPFMPDSLLLLTTAFILTNFALLKLKSLDLPRVSWRPHTSVLYRYTHHEEIVSLNRLVTFFEEHHEINVKNYHISKVRTWANSDSFQAHDYELMLPPDGPQLVSPQVDILDKQYERMMQYVRSELLQRKIIWNPLDEEKMFLQFWLDHGETFEWVEPDQDPAEIRILKSPNSTF